jgi:hypothetical protein
MGVWKVLVAVVGVTLLVELFFELRNQAQRKDGLVLGIYQESVAPRHGSPRRTEHNWWRTPEGFFGALAALVSGVLTPATFLLALSHESNDIPWGIFGLGVLGVLYFLTGVWASGASGTLRAGLTAGTLLAAVTAVLMLVATSLGEHSWSVGPWSSEAPSLVAYLAYFVALFVVFGLPGLALCAGGAILGRSRSRWKVAQSAQARRKSRSR